MSGSSGDIDTNKDQMTSNGQRNSEAPPQPKPNAKDPAVALVREKRLESQEHRLTIETWIRGFTLVLIVIAIVTYPMYALIVGISGATLSEAIAPITGIAGAIVGYWFGQASRRISSIEGGQPEGNS